MCKGFCSGCRLEYSARLFSTSGHLIFFEMTHILINHHKSYEASREIIHNITHKPTNPVMVCSVVILNMKVILKIVLLLLIGLSYIATHKVRFLIKKKLWENKIPLSQDMSVFVQRCEGSCNKNYCKISYVCRPLNRTAKNLTLNIVFHPGISLEAPITVNCTNVKSMIVIPTFNRSK